MQLLLILALLLYGGKKGGGDFLKEVKPVLESIGGEDFSEALKNAEEITQALSVVKELAATQPTQGFAAPSAQGFAAPSNEENRENNSKEAAIAFPLEPVSKIADRDITYSLSQYFSQN